MDQEEPDVDTTAQTPVRGAPRSGEWWKRLVSAGGGFVVGIAVNLISPRVDLQGFALLVMFFVLTSFLAWLQRLPSDAPLTVSSPWIMRIIAVIALLLVIKGPEHWRNFAWAVVALFGAFSALVPQARDNAQAVVGKLHELVTIVGPLRFLVVAMLYGFVAGGLIFAVNLLWNQDYKTAVMSALFSMVFLSALLWWTRGRANLSSVLTAAIGFVFAEIGAFAATEGDVFGAMMFLGVSISLIGLGLPGLASLSRLRGIAFIGAAVFFGTEYMFGIWTGELDDTTVFLALLAAIFLLIGATGNLLTCTGLASATLLGGTCALGLAIYGIWQSDSALSSITVSIIYGIVGIADGISTVSTAGVPAQIRSWWTFLVSGKQGEARPVAED